MVSSEVVQQGICVFTWNRSRAASNKKEKTSTTTPLNRDLGGTIDKEHPCTPFCLGHIATLNEEVGYLGII